MLLSADLKPFVQAEMSQRFYRPELDVLRFGAFFSVFYYHMAFHKDSPGVWFQAAASAASFGMCLFFVLSSFLITELLLREKEITGTIHIKSFYIRRILRIWPLYFAFIALTWVLGHYAYSWTVTGKTVLSFSLLAGNWYLIHINGRFGGPLMPLWSISLEEQSVISAALVPVALCSIAFLAHKGWHAYSIWWNSFVQVMFFGIGALLAIYTHVQIQQRSKVDRLLLFLGGVIAWWGGAYLNELAVSVAAPAFLLMSSYSCAAAGCIAFLFAFLGANPKWPGVLIYLGKISYGLYVFHVLCPDVVAQALRTLWPRLPDHGGIYKSVYMTLGLIFTIATAYCSYNWFEKPFLKWKERFALVQSRPT